MSTSFCLKHHDRPATARCQTCHKPLCGECVVRAEGMEFCSVACQANHKRFYSKYQESGAPGLLARLRRFVVNLAILAGLLAVAVVLAAKVWHVGFCEALLKRLVGW